MALTEKQADLVQNSFKRVLDVYDPSETGFFDAFFRNAPHLRAMFRDDLAGQEMQFMTALKVIVDNLGQSASLKPRYEDLGKAHAIIGVRPEDFKPMGEALIETLKSVLGDEFSPETEAAWKLVYKQVASLISQSAGQV